MKYVCELCGRELHVDPNGPSDQITNYCGECLFGRTDPIVRLIDATNVDFVRNTLGDEER